MIRQLLASGWEASVCLNVNFPDVAPEQAGPLQVTSQGAGRMDSLNVTARTDMRELDYFWLNIERHDRGDAPGSETHVVMNGGVSVTPLRFERSDVAAARILAERLRDTHGND